MKTLVVRLDHLGDLVLTTPLVRALAMAGHEVDVLVRQAFESIFDHSPYVQQCFAIERVAPRFPQAWRTLARWMRQRGYDAIVLAYAKQKQLCFASAFSGTKHRVAMWGGIWGRLTLHRCLASHILTRPRAFSDILLDCSRALGVPDQGLKPDLFLTDKERADLHAFLPAGFRGRTLIGIHPGSAGNACNLPSPVYAAVAARILDKSDCAIVVTGSSGEKTLLREWPDELIASERVWISMGELSLRQLACAIAETRVYVCSSTGPLHIASAVGTPTVSPFCPAVSLCAAIWGNKGAPARVIEPEYCPARAGTAACCDFGGQISADQIVDQIFELMAVKIPLAES